MDAMSTLRSLTALLACLAVSAVEADSVVLPAQVGGAYSVPVMSIKARRYAATVRQQYDFSCGSAAIATLLTHHYKYPVSEDSVFAEMFQRGDQPKIRVEGFSLLDMKRYLEAHGFQADGYQEPLEKLVSATIPAIVLINDSGYNHFVVVKGLRNGRVLIGDPSGGTRSLALPAFQALWVNPILFVITNRQNLASFNSPDDWRATPTAPIGGAVGRDSLAGIVIPKFGPGDF